MLRRIVSFVLSRRMLTALWGLSLWAGFPALLSAYPNYIVRTWQAEQGLPQNKVTAMVQTRDGYMWVGTYSGLARFDGVQFTVFDENNTPAMRSSRVTSLSEAPDGTLWIGDEGGHLTQYRDGQFKAVAFHPAWNGGKIYELAADETGLVWAMNADGQLARAKDGLAGVSGQNSEDTLRPNVSASSQNELSRSIAWVSSAMKM